MIAHFLVLLGVLAWMYLPRPWHPTLTLDTPHYTIASTATPEQTRDIAGALALLYDAYSNQFGALPGFQAQHPRLQVKLFKDRAEFRRINRGLGWAEAFYREPYCRAYFAADETNPYHWMLHECVHQLNHEVAHAELAQWLDEGLAEYFSTSRLQPDHLAAGRIDPNTYPVWWIEEIATRPDLAENLRNGSVIPLRSIITGHGGPSMNREFNLYSLHWWTLAHFLLENAPYRGRALELVRQGGTLEAFEQTIGPVEQVQTEWHAYFRRLRTALTGTDLGFFKTGKLPDDTNSLPKP